ncbi:hypothetical protein EYF80_048710 [Liparis tanakae]|uniref:Uncharacterized protein n=1 Tax=Liparis tanakae TaxID=230148 RepID=A0A4Z2FK25_9TELE|nr:hypothetical protein EYF80_048710 [Liparis tanakae]
MVDTLIWEVEGETPPPVRSIRSWRARVSLTPPCCISISGENSGIEISSSLEAGLEHHNEEITCNARVLEGHACEAGGRMFPRGYPVTHLTSMDRGSSQDPVPFTSSGFSVMRGGDR